MNKTSLLLREIVDTIFSHNELIALWHNSKRNDCKKLIWEGEAWAIPDEYLDFKFDRIFGSIPENIFDADKINILVIVDNEAALIYKLPKKEKDTTNCFDGN